MKQNQIFFWNSPTLSMIQQMLVICSLVPLPFWKSICTSEGLSSHTTKAYHEEFWALPLLAMWSEHNCTVVWPFFGIVLLWDWNENWPFPVMSVQLSHSVMSNSLRPHELQHTRPPCPSRTPGVHSDSRPLSQWCHPAISSSASPSPPAPNPSQHQSLFRWVNSLHVVAKVLEFQL